MGEILDLSSLVVFCLDIQILNPVEEIFFPQHGQRRQATL